MVPQSFAAVPSAMPIGVQLAPATSSYAPVSMVQAVPSYAGTVTNQQRYQVLAPQAGQGSSLEDLKELMKLIAEFGNSSAAPRSSAPRAPARSVEERVTKIEADLRELQDQVSDHTTVLKRLIEKQSN